MYQRILVCVDESDASANALQAALRLAASPGSAVRILHVLEHPTSLGGYPYGDQGQHFVELARRQAEVLLQEAVETARLAQAKCDARLVDGAGRRFGDVVAGEARDWDADLVVVGSHGRRGLSRALLGSGAEQVVRDAPVPVLVVRDARAGRPSLTAAARTCRTDAARAARSTGP